MRPAVVLAAAAGLCVLGAGPVAAQLAESPKTDQQIGFFLLRADASGRWVGAVTSKGSQDLDDLGHYRVAWQLDYGSLGVKRVSASGTESGDETAVSKNSGSVVVGYSHRAGSHWLWAADGGLEHKRTAPTVSRPSIEHTVSPLVVGSARWVGAQALGDVDRGPELAWSLQPMLSAAKAVTTAGQRRRLFFEPVAVVWFSAWRTTTETKSGHKVLRYRVQVRGEAALVRAIDGALDAASHYDASLTYFITPANGIALRRFDGYFDHNLRDRKRATTLTLVWKFK